MIEKNALYGKLGDLSAQVVILGLGYVGYRWLRCWRRLDIM